MFHGTVRQHLAVYAGEAERAAEREDDAQTSKLARISRR